MITLASILESVQDRRKTKQLNKKQDAYHFVKITFEDYKKIQELKRQLKIRQLRKNISTTV